MPTFTAGPQHDDADWNTAANWDTNEVPKDGDDVTIGDDVDWASPIYPGGDLSLNNLTIGRQSLVMDMGTITCQNDFNLSGTIADGGIIRVAGSGTVSCVAADRAPSLLNDTALVVTGTLTVQGPGSFQIGGGQCRITNSGTMIFINSTVTWFAGANPIVENTGVISVVGTAVWAGGDVRNHGSVSVSSGSSLVISTNGLLRQMGDGQIKGPGTITVGEPLGYGAALNIEGMTVLPADLTLELTANGMVYTPAGGSSNPPTLKIQGKLVIQDGSLNAWTTLALGATCTITGSDATLYGGRFQNLGTVTVESDKVLNLTSGIDLINAGRFTLSGGSTVVHNGGDARFRNQGLVVGTGSKMNTFDGLEFENAGNLVVEEGSVALIREAVIDLTGGVLDLKDTKIITPDLTGTLRISNGTVGGVLRGHGTIEAGVVNQGLVEPDGTGLTLRTDYEQDENGGLVIMQGVDDTYPPLVVKGTAALNGSLFVRAR